MVSDFDEWQNVLFFDAINVLTLMMMMTAVDKYIDNAIDVFGVLLVIDILCYCLYLLLVG